MTRVKKKNTEKQEKGEEDRGERELDLHCARATCVLNHWCVAFMSLRLHTAWIIRATARVLQISECHF